MSRIGGIPRFVTLVCGQCYRSREHISGLRREGTLRLSSVRFSALHGASTAIIPPDEMPCSWQHESEQLELFPVPRENGISYELYIRSLDWESRRNSVLRRDGYRCQECGSTIALHVHHLTYRNLGDEPHWELLTLCGDCHHRRHKEWVPGVYYGCGYDPLGTKTEWRLANRRSIIVHAAQMLLIGKNPGCQLAESYWAEDMYGPFTWV